MDRPAGRCHAVRVEPRSYDAFSVKTEHDSPVDFQAKGKAPLDIVVRQHDYVPGASAGWHTRPGPIFITVQGAMTFYEYNDPMCTPKVVSAGQGYVDDGHGHIGINNSGARAMSP